MGKYSGMSFGGFFGGGLTVSSQKFKLNIYKDRKTKQYTYNVKRKRIPTTFPVFFFIFPLLDLILYVAQYRPDIIITAGSKINIGLPSFYIPIWIFNILMYSLLIGLFIFLYYFSFKGVATWHGCEHKIIEAAEKNDVDNAILYSPISDRCGGTYMFSIYGSMAVYWFVAFKFFNVFVPVGFMTFSVLIVFLESRLFHKYNFVGIWLGRKLQKYVTIKEPETWKIQLGIKGMNELIMQS